MAAQLPEGVVVFEKRLVSYREKLESDRVVLHFADGVFPMLMCSSDATEFTPPRVSCCLGQATQPLVQASAMW
jgi:hypothetical protein